jgi:hypothetical protein
MLRSYPHTQQAPPASSTRIVFTFLRRRATASDRQRLQR